MTLILNGTDNSATTPAVTGTDTDTGVYYPAANQVALATNGTLALIVDASQNIGVGTASPVMKVQIESTVGLGYKVKRTSNGVAGGIGAGAQTGGQGLAIFTTDYFSDTPIIFGVNQTDSSVNPFVGLTERMRVNGGAPILCLAGGNTSATGTGIAFPATQSASSDANTLDDYEEGTFTPTFTFTGGAGTLTYSSQFGAYTKIGNMVTCQGLVVVANKGTASGDIALTLPFASATNVYAAAALTWNGFTYSAGSYTITAQNGSSGVLLSFYNEPSGGSKTGLTPAQGNTSFEIIFAITYRV